MKHCIVLIALFFAGINLTGAQNLFMKFDSKSQVPATSVKKGYTEWIDLEAMAAGVENSVNIGSISAGGGAGKATFKELSITRYTDIATPYIVKRLTSGEHFDQLTIHKAKKMPDGSFQPFVEYVLEMVMVSDYHMSMDTGNPTESITLQVGKMKINVMEYDTKGMKTKTHTFGWDRISNMAWK